VKHDARPHVNGLTTAPVGFHKARQLVFFEG